MSQHSRQSDRNAVEFPFRLIELRTFACFPVSQTYKYELTLMVGMSPIGSYVDGLTSKGQVGVLLEEHRGWILRMAFGKNRGATWNRHSF